MGCLHINKGIVFFSTYLNVFTMKSILYIFFFGTFTLLTLETCGQKDKRDQEVKDNQEEANTEKKSPGKMIDYLVGEWEIDKVLSGKKDVTDRKGGDGQTLTFTQEARYIMYSGNEKIDSGAYRMNEQTGSLYLESESDEEPHEWKVDFKSGRMILSLKQDALHGENLRYIYRRIHPASAREN
jgi:hypothetical protein